MNERIKEAEELEKDIVLHHAEKYLSVNHSKSSNSDFQAAMNIAVLKAYIAGWNESKSKQWISVDEALPPYEEDVFVMNADGDAFGCWRTKSDVEYKDENDFVNYHPTKIIRWMPIPPTEGGGE